MQSVSSVELRATLVELSAAVAVMQSELKALMSTHPDPAAVRAVFLREIEKNTARSLALPVPDELSERIQALARRVLSEMPGKGEPRDETVPRAIQDD